VLGLAKVHFVDEKNKVDTWTDISVIAPIDDTGLSVDWSHGKAVTDVKDQLDKTSIPGSSFEELPEGLVKAKNYPVFEKSFSSSLYQNQVLNIFKCDELKLTSTPGETESSFRMRIAQALNEKRSEAAQKLQSKYADKEAKLVEKIKQCQGKLAEQKSKAGWKTAENIISVGSTLLGALFGRGITKGTISQTASSIKRAGRTGKESEAASQAQQECQNYQQQLDDLHAQMDNETRQLSSSLDPNTTPLDKIQVHPRKSDISVDKVVLIWWPGSF
jgi:hypothetical protein